MHRLTRALATSLLLMSIGCRDGGCRLRNLWRGAPPAAKKAPAKEAPAKSRKDGPAQPTIVLIVMDTVRADHMSLCGYERPTTPFLDSIAAKSGGVSFTCDAYSPGTWTIPSHASYFTGVDVPEHGNDSMGVPFGEDIRTLAEVLGERGYQSILWSANPTLSKSSGLWRGFDVADVSRDLSTWRGPAVAGKLRSTLKKADRDKPLFLFVNLLDAHDPYPAIPNDVTWLEPRKALPFYVHDPQQDARYHKFIRGEMPDDQAAAYLDAVRDGYDYGVSLADGNVDRVLEVIRSEGWLEGDFRIIVTSDHGEFLGEHQLLRHGCYTWEPVVNVPIIFYDPTRREKLEFPNPVSATEVFWLASEGRLRDVPIPVTSYSKRRELDVKGCADMTALWPDPDDKLVWMEGEYLQFDLAADPGELGRVALPEDHPHRAALDEQARRHQAHLEEVRGTAVDEARSKELQALGYLE